MIPKEIKQVHDRYKQSVNMTYSELKQWYNNPCSKEASIGRDAIKRNLKLLSKPYNKWTASDASEALKTISFNARMQKVKAGSRVDGCNLSKRTISLKNWAFNPNK